MKRSAIPLVLLILVIIASIVPAAAEDNSPNAKNTAGVIQACEMAGGTVESSPSDDRTNSNGGPSKGFVKCTGGGMNGVGCATDNSGIYCTWQPPGAPSKSEGSGQEIVVDAQDVTLASELPADAGISLMPDAVESPMLVEAVITWNPSAEAATQEGVDLVNGCRLLGGTEFVAYPDGNPGAGSFTVQCDGAVINGLWCAFGVGLSTCFFEPGSGPDVAATGNSTMTPTDAPMPTVAMPTEPPAQQPEASATTAPTTTSEPTPTEEPVIEPTAPPATDAGPWTVPEGTLPVFEPAEPTPTEVILL